MTTPTTPTPASPQPSPPPVAPQGSAATRGPSPAQIVGLGAAIAIGLFLLGVAIINAPAAWRAIQSAAVSVSAQFFPAQEQEGATTQAAPQTSTPTELRVTVSEPVVQSGAPFTLAWDYTPSTKGSYAISFPCREGVAVYIPDRFGVYKPAPCDTPITIGDEQQKTLRVIVVSDGEATYRDIPFTLAFYPEGASQPAATGSAIATVEFRADSARVVTERSTSQYPPRSTATSNAAAATSGSTASRESSTSSASAGSSSQTRSAQREAVAGTPQTTRYPLPAATSSAQRGGLPNLVVRPIAVGYIDTATNTFVATTSPLTPDKRVAVKFEVKNEGGAKAPRWLFAAVLPTMPPYIFRSQLQQELNPGDRIEFVLAFDKIRTDQSQGEVRINVDPDNKVRESDESDNMISIFIPIKHN